jgi:hypothetical protein
MSETEHGVCEHCGAAVTVDIHGRWRAGDGPLPYLCEVNLHDQRRWSTRIHIPRD